MKLLLLPTLLALQTQHALAQPPNGGGDGNGPPNGDGPPSGGGSMGGGDACDQCGSSASYSEAISEDSTSGVLLRSITTNGCPNHYSVCTGKAGKDACNSVGLEGTATEAQMNSAEGDGSSTITVPAQPVFSETTTDIECDMGAIAIALNGVGIFGGAVDTECTLLDPDDDSSEWVSFDMCSGHSQQSGTYHYHFPPSCLIKQAGEEQPASLEGHSPQIGWSYDGFPIYGPLGVNGESMQAYESDFCQSNPDSYLCLDTCGGRMEELEGLDEFKYRYYFNGATSDLATLPSTPQPNADDYPYAIKCYVGCTSDELTTGSCNVAGNGYTDAYEATETEGITSIFDMYGDVDEVLGSDSIAAECVAQASGEVFTEETTMLSSTTRLRRSTTTTRKKGSKTTTTKPTAQGPSDPEACAVTICGDSVCMDLAPDYSPPDFAEAFPDCDCSACYPTITSGKDDGLKKVSPTPDCEWWNCS